MGNCLACLKEPPPTTTTTTIPPECVKEDMPETPQQQQLSLSETHHHLPVPTIETSLISNGNHLISAPETARIYNYPRKIIKSAPAMGISESKPSETKLNQLFDIYKDDEDLILEEGIEQLCKDLQVSPDEFKVLLLAWKLNAEQMCRFTRLEFITGLKNLRVDSIKNLQSTLPDIVKEVERNDESFKNLYRFTFKFGLDSLSGQRILPVEVAIILWKLVFTVREPPILERWLNFLKKHEQYRGIPKDTWNMFLNFSDTVGNDLSSYDDNEAWPSLFDDFVEYENDQANQNITKESLFITHND